MPKVDRILANLPPTFATMGDPSALRAIAGAFGGELQAAENSLVAVMRAHWVDFADQGEVRIVDLAGIGALYGLAPRPDESVEEFRDHLKRYVRTFLDGTVTVQGLLRITAEVLGLHIEDDALDTWWTRDDPVLVTSSQRGADAASAIFGTPSFESAGHDALPAAIDGTVDLRAGVDLRSRDRLWIAVDGHGAVPVDLAAGVDAAAVQPDQIAAAINATFGIQEFATIVDGRLRLASQTTGPEAEVLIADGPDDAADLVLGLRSRDYRGSDATHATVTGTADISTAVDLTTDRYLRIAVDGQHVAEIDCASGAADPAAVDIGEITDAINDALGITVASDDGRLLTLTSPTPGVAGMIEFQPPAAQPATRRLFGNVPAITRGIDAHRAAVVGDRDLGPGVDLRATPRLRLGVDAQAPVTVDIAGADPITTTPAEIVAAINEALQDNIASHDGRTLTVGSSTPGAASRLLVDEIDEDAADAVLGLRSRRARGVPPDTASLTGLIDLSGGADISARSAVSLAVDSAAPIEIDLRRGVADPARASVDELRDAINDGLGAPTDEPVATTDGAHLILVSPSEGAAGRIAVEPLELISRRRFVTRARVTDDAGPRVFGYPAGRANGEVAVAARVEGTTDLAAGIDLTVNRYLRLRVDGHDAVEVDCAGPRPRATTPAEIVQKINAAASGVAVTDGHTITLVGHLRSGIVAGDRRAAEPGCAGCCPRSATGDPTGRTGNGCGVHRVGRPVGRDRIGCRRCGAIGRRRTGTARHHRGRRCRTGGAQSEPACGDHRPGSRSADRDARRSAPAAAVTDNGRDRQPRVPGAEHRHRCNRAAARDSGTTQLSRLGRHCRRAARRERSERRGRYEHGEPAHHRRRRRGTCHGRPLVGGPRRDSENCSDREPDRHRYQLTDDGPVDRREHPWRVGVADHLAQHRAVQSRRGHRNRRR